ncbi:hypothetical protein CPJCM30710_15910 [Clostridium polyendosporum]|uniref:Uncharacterized protein n=1 Tax=Clostridium polyendosporum TaxID=69208 RepID=A0A919RYL4_9CLOT|nr:hypothetical protein [Clostridium polyendosporum]GIM28925.1 hypothetical protein CPJCM30710_15910 [Clostridium polyendosporum]
MSCNYAYDAWKQMVNKGCYSLSPAPQAEIDVISTIYNEVNQPKI